MSPSKILSVFTIKKNEVCHDPIYSQNGEE
jgi:hypothetical protein